MRNFISIEDTGAVLGLEKREVFALIRSGELPFDVLGGRFYVDEDAVRTRLLAMQALQRGLPRGWQASALAQKAPQRRTRARASATGATKAPSPAPPQPPRMGLLTADEAAADARPAAKDLEAERQKDLIAELAGYSTLRDPRATAAG
ncbi:MAG: hypothetical protein ACREL3_08145 [Gemmatimonadales bacterium]